VSVPEDPKRSSAPAYARAGVDLDDDEGFIDEIREITRSTLRPEILSSVGGFAGLFKFPERYENPIFVAAADGVGTKLKLAAQLERFDTVGIDCVAMVVNDLVVQGAEPLVFLDYVAMSKLDRARARQALRGVAEGCRRAGCALLGGETATMPGVYPEGEIELVGFAVGVVERDRVIDGSGISQGDAVLGLASSGCHSNGYSLVRSIVEAGAGAGRIDLRAENAELNTSVAAALLAPTRIYVKSLLNVMRDFTIKGMAHITGGGFPGNVPRILPKGVRARIDPNAWPRPQIFGLLQREGRVSEDEMLRVFNCGIGMVLVVSAEQESDVLDRLRAVGERAYRIGEIEAKGPDDSAVLFGPPASGPRASGSGAGMPWSWAARCPGSSPRCGSPSAGRAC
jgi:phosphoribosylformylglycinamidine cyclo-ligase